MSFELLYTSATRGLKPGSRGFCTVLCTDGIPRQLMDRLEALSGYRPVFPPGHPQNALNPVARSHLLVTIGGATYSVLSRIADYGLDYTQRNNKLADHRAIVPAERPLAGPAWLLERSGFLRTSWNEEPRRVERGPAIPAGDRPVAKCSASFDLAGDEGWAGALAQSFLDHPRRPSYIVFEPGIDPLPLLADAISLLPPERRWEATFCTYYSSLPPDAICQWRCVLKGSDEDNGSRRFPDAFRIDLTTPGRTTATGPLVDLARTGVRAAPKAAAAGSPPPPPLPMPTIGGGAGLEGADFDSFEDFEAQQRFDEYRQRKKRPQPARGDADEGSAATYALAGGPPVPPPVVPPPPPTVAPRETKGKVPVAAIAGGGGVALVVVIVGMLALSGSDDDPAGDAKPPVSAAAANDPGESVPGEQIASTDQGHSIPQESYVPETNYPDPPQEAEGPKAPTKPPGDRKPVENSRAVDADGKEMPAPAAGEKTPQSDAAPMASKIVSRLKEAKWLEKSLELPGVGDEESQMSLKELPIKNTGDLEIFVHHPLYADGARLSVKKVEDQIAVSMHSDLTGEKSLARLNLLGGEDESGCKLDWIWEPNVDERNREQLSWCVVEFASTKESWLVKFQPKKNSLKLDAKGTAHASPEVMDRSLPEFHADRMMVSIPQFDVEFAFTTTSSTSDQPSRIDFESEELVKVLTTQFDSELKKETFPTIAVALGGGSAEARLQHTGPFFRSIENSLNGHWGLLHRETKREFKHVLNPLGMNDFDINGKSPSSVEDYIRLLIAEVDLALKDKPNLEARKAEIRARFDRLRQKSQLCAKYTYGIENAKITKARFYYVVRNAAGEERQVDVLNVAEQQPAADEK